MAINYQKINWDVAPYKYANPDNMATMDNGIKSACDFADANANNGLGETSGGRNLWDEKWEVGSYYFADGTKREKSDTIRNANYMIVKSSTSYHCASSKTSRIAVLYYDTNKAFISYTDNVQNTNFTTPSNAKYLNFFFEQSTYIGSEIAIIEGTSGSYEPYYESNKMLTEDANEIASLKYLGWTVPREMPIKNYVDSNGTFHQRVGRVDLGTFSWTHYEISDGGHLFRSASVPIESNNIFCYKYVVKTASTRTDKSIYVNESINKIDVVDSSYTDATAFRSAMSGVYLYYELSSAVEIAEGNEKSEVVATKLDELETKNGLKVIEKGTISAGSSISFNLDNATAYVFVTSYAIVGERSFSIMFGGSSANASQKATVNTLVSGSNISFSVGSTSGEYSKITVSNSASYLTYYGLYKLT